MTKVNSNEGMKKLERMFKKKMNTSKFKAINIKKIDNIYKWIPNVVNIFEIVISSSNDSKMNFCMQHYGELIHPYPKFMALFRLVREFVYLHTIDYIKLLAFPDWSEEIIKVLRTIDDDELFNSIGLDKTMFEGFKDKNSFIYIKNFFKDDLVELINILSDDTFALPMNFGVFEPMTMYFKEEILKKFKVQ